MDIKDENRLIGNKFNLNRYKLRDWILKSKNTKTSISKYYCYLKSNYENKTNLVCDLLVYKKYF